MMAAACHGPDVCLVPCHSHAARSSSTSTGRAEGGTSARCWRYGDDAASRMPPSVYTHSRFAHVTCSPLVTQSPPPTEPRPRSPTPVWAVVGRW